MSGRRPATRLLATGLLLPALLASAGWPALATEPGVVGASPTLETVPDGPLQAGTLVITDIRPLAPRPDDPFQVLGTVTNTASRPITDVTVGLRLGARLDTRSDLALHDDLEDPQDFPRGEPVPVAEVLAAGDEVPVDLRTMVSELQMAPDRIGVYPLTIRVTATDDEGTSFTLDEAHTYLPWFNDDPIGRQRLAFLIPLVDQPRMGPDEAFVDTVLPDLLGRQGRLGSLLAATRQPDDCAPTAPARPTDLSAPGRTRPDPPDEPSTCLRTPVTFAVDPDLLYSASALTLKHRLRPYGETTAEVLPPSSQARAFLSRLTAAAAGPDDLLALPFATPDVVAITGDDSTLDEMLPGARSLGRELTTLLAGEPLDTVAMVPPGPVSEQALAALAASGTAAVVLAESSLVLAEGTDRTAGTRVPLLTSQGRLTGLVIEKGLSNLLMRDRPIGASPSPRLLRQRWLAETAMIAAEAPNDERTLLVALPRREAVDPARLQAALVDTGRVPWMCPVSLQAVVSGVESCPGAQPVAPEPTRQGTVRTTLGEDPGASITPLSASLIQRVNELRAEAEQFTTAVLAGSDEAIAAEQQRYQRAILRTLSTAWRTDPAPGRRLTERLAADLAALRQKVVLNAQSVLLTGKDSRLDVAITNGLDKPVKLKVTLGPSTERLRVAGPELVQVPARTTRPVTLDAEPLSSGRFLVTVQLLDRNGQPFGEAQRLQIRSTQYGTLALAVTGLATGILMVAAGVRLTRRALGAQRRRKMPA